MCASFFVECPLLEFGNLDMEVVYNYTAKNGTMGVFAPQECPTAAVVLKCGQGCQDRSKVPIISMNDRCPERIKGINLILEKG